MVAAPNMNDARYSDGNVLLADGRVLIAGGSNDTTSQRSGILASAEIYDPVQNSWTLLPGGESAQRAASAQRVAPGLYADAPLR
jgi:hypothetical protein